MNIKSIKQQKNQLMIAAVVIATVALAALLAWWLIRQHKSAVSYDDCIKSGGQVLFSYPSQCIDKTGKHFNNPSEQSPVFPQEVKPL